MFNFWNDDCSLFSDKGKALKCMNCCVMDSYLRLSNSPAGRDKVFRFIQYTSKFLHSSFGGDANDAALLIRRMRALEAAMSLLRKGMRLGKSVDTLQGAVSTLRIADPVVKATTTLSRVHQALYLAVDNLLWADKIGLISVAAEKRAKWNDLCNRFWLYFLIANLIRDLHEIAVIVKARRKLLKDLKDSRSSGLEGIKATICADVTAWALVRHIVVNHGDVSADFLKNVCDLFIPLASLGFLKLPPSLVGLFGAASSALSILAILKPHYRLNPA